MISSMNGLLLSIGPLFAISQLGRHRVYIEHCCKSRSLISLIRIAGPLRPTTDPVSTIAKQLRVSQVPAQLTEAVNLTATILVEATK
jgi:hypothetical protein